MKFFWKVSHTANLGESTSCHWCACTNCSGSPVGSHTLPVCRVLGVARSPIRLSAPGTKTSGATRTPGWNTLRADHSKCGKTAAGIWIQACEGKPTGKSSSSKASPEDMQMFASGFATHGRCSSLRGLALTFARRYCRLLIRRSKETNATILAGTAGLNALSGVAIVPRPSTPTQCGRRTI